MKLSPDWPEARYALILSNYNLGNALADLRQYADAVGAYQRAIELNAQSSVPQKMSKPHNNLGLAYAALGRIPDAISEFERAVELRGDYAEARFNLGIAYLQTDNKEAARGQQRLLLKLNPELAARLETLLKQ